MDKIYVIATTYEDADLDMFHYYNSEEACHSIFSLVKEDYPDFREPNPKDDPQDYYREYYDYICDHECDKFLPDYQISLYIIDQKEKEVSHAWY